MTFKTCLSVLTAAAVTALFASTSLAVDPNLGAGATNPYGVAPFNTNGASLPGVYDRYGNLINGVPVDGVQSLSIPTRIGLPDYAVNGTIPVSPINSTISTDPRLNPGISPGLIPGTPSQPNQPRWKLGVYSKDTDTGVRVIQVVQNSAAARAGLEANDIIISVGGYQVGYVNGQLYDCATEFERSANNDGWVSMLVQDSRTGRLRNLPVQLEARFSRLTGSIVLNGGGQLPVGSYAVVELQEILRPGVPPNVLNTCRIDNPTGYQIPFELKFDPQQVDTRRTYVVTGRVMAANQTIYAPRNTVQVLAPNTPQQVNLAFDRVGSGVIGPYAQDAQLAQILALYQQYLNRQPTYAERSVWEQDLARGTSLNDVKAYIFGRTSSSMNVAAMNASTSTAARDQPRPAGPSGRTRLLDGCLQPAQRHPHAGGTGLPERHRRPDPGSRQLIRQGIRRIDQARGDNPRAYFFGISPSWGGRHESRQTLRSHARSGIARDSPAARQPNGPTGCSVEWTRRPRSRLPPPSGAVETPSGPRKSHLHCRSRQTCGRCTRVRCRQTRDSIRNQTGQIHDAGAPPRTGCRRIANHGPTVVARRPSLKPSNLTQPWVGSASYRTWSAIE